MSFDLLKTLQTMGPAALGVASILFLMAIASMAVVVERLWTFRKGHSASIEFSAVAKRSLEHNDHAGLITRSAELEDSPLASLVVAGLTTHRKETERGAGRAMAIELTRRELERRSDRLVADLRRGLALLASVGSVAPFVGLLGTVLGIIAAFQGIAREGSGGLGSVSAGISEALVETALGLVVAIPAVLAHNFLSTRIDRQVIALDQAKGELIDHLEATTGIPVHNPHKPAEVSIAHPRAALEDLLPGAVNAA